MKFVNKEFSLKNGEIITIREANIADATELINVAKSYISDSEHILLTFKEFTPTVEQEEKWIKSYIDKKNNILLVATYKNSIIGNIEITSGSRLKINHTGLIGMSIIKQWRNLGLGTVLLDCVINWSRNNSDLVKLWLQVFANNEAGINLYKKMKFIEEGRQKDFIKISENKFVDNVIMGLSLR